MLRFGDSLPEIPNNPYDIDNFPELRELAKSVQSGRLSEWSFDKLELVLKPLLSIIDNYPSIAELRSWVSDIEDRARDAEYAAEAAERVAESAQEDCRLLERRFSRSIGRIQDAASLIEESGRLIGSL